MSNEQTLLVVEDDVDVRESIVEALEHLNIKIITAENGKEGLEKALSLKPSAILSDINMPQMNGLDFLAQLRQHQPDTPFIVLTAFADKPNTVKALRMGAFDFLDKPFDIENLEKVVKKALEVGFYLQALELEMAKIVDQKNLTEEQLKKLREAKKHLLMMRYQIEDASKKAS